VGAGLIRADRRTGLTKAISASSEYVNSRKNGAEQMTAVAGF
jgi:hypothetical protein